MIFSNIRLFLLYPRNVESVVLFFKSHFTELCEIQSLKINIKSIFSSKDKSKLLFVLAITINSNQQGFKYLSTILCYLKNHFALLQSYLLPFYPLLDVLYLHLLLALLLLDFLLPVPTLLILVLLVLLLLVLLLLVLLPLTFPLNPDYSNRLRTV